MTEYNLLCLSVDMAMTTNVDELVNKTIAYLAEVRKLVASKRIKEEDVHLYITYLQRRYTQFIF
jgi:hypothetical protein